jgi:hypothetical protein
MVLDMWFEACARGVGLDEVQYLNAIFLSRLARNLREGKLKKGIPSDLKKLIPVKLYEKLCDGV